VRQQISNEARCGISEAKNPNRELTVYFGVFTPVYKLIGDWSLSFELDSQHQFDSPDEDSFDIIHGVNLDNLDQPLVLYRNRKDAVALLNKVLNQQKIAFVFAMLVMFVPMMVVLFQTHSSSSAFLITLGIILAMMIWTVSFMSLAIWNGKRLAEKDLTESLKPILEIKKDGVSINCPGRTFENIPWEVIKDVRSYSFQNYRLLGITPTDVETVLKYATKDSSSFGKFPNSLLFGTKSGTRFAALYSRYLALWKYFHAPIFIVENWLPLSASVADLINARRNHALGICQNLEPDLLVESREMQS
jgi:hypothetical protein